MMKACSESVTPASKARRRHFNAYLYGEGVASMHIAAELNFSLYASFYYVEIKISRILKRLATCHDDMVRR